MDHLPCRRGAEEQVYRKYSPVGENGELSEELRGDILREALSSIRQKGGYMGKSPHKTPQQVFMQLYRITPQDLRCPREFFRTRIARINTDEKNKNPCESVSQRLVAAGGRAMSVHRLL